MSFAVHFSRPDTIAARDAARAPIVGNEPKNIISLINRRASECGRKKFTACEVKFFVGRSIAERGLVKNSI